MKLILSAAALAGERSLPSSGRARAPCRSTGGKRSPPAGAGRATCPRHYQALARRAFGVCDGFYPLGSLYHEVQPQAGEAAARRLYRSAPQPPTVRRSGRPGPGEHL